VRFAVYAAACRRVDYDPAITVQLVAMKKDVRRPPQPRQSSSVGRPPVFIRSCCCDALRVAAQAAGISEKLLRAFPRLERAPLAKGTAGAVLVIRPSSGGGWNPMLWNPMRLAANVLKAGVLIGRLEFP
jgi:hypothetical protein